MISRLNTLTKPLELLIAQKARYIRYFLLGLSLFAFSTLFISYFSGDAEYVKETGENALLILWIILFLPVVAKVGTLSIARILMMFRKELGILMGVLAWVHSVAYLRSDLSAILTIDFWIADGQMTFLAAGMIALILTTPLLLTSNNFLIKKMGRYWKILHRLVYGVLIFTIAHVVLLSMGGDHPEYGGAVLMVGYFILKGLEWKGISLGKKK